MNKKWLLLIVLGLAVILAAPALTGCTIPASAQDKAAQVQISQDPQGIWVTGTGELSITPDIATISLGVTAQETSVSQAQTEASEAMTKVMKALSDSGIASKDIQTGYFSINQRTRWDGDKQMESVVGYEVNNMVTVRLRQPDNAGKIIDVVVQAGGNLIRVNGISFSVEDPSKNYTEVRQKAIAAARNKADELAKLAGVTLGKPVYIAENAQYTPNYRAYSNFALSTSSAAPEIAFAPPISAGETKITLSVQVAYSIVP
jgi:uncharacterized protein